MKNLQHAQLNPNSIYDLGWITSFIQVPYLKNILQLDWICSNVPLALNQKCMIQWHLYTSYQLHNLGQSLNFSGPINTFSVSKFLKCKREVEMYPPLSSRSECLSSSEGSQGKILYQLSLPWKKRTLFPTTEFNFHIPTLHWAVFLCYPISKYSLQCRDSCLFDSIVTASIRSSIPFQETDPKASGSTGSWEGVKSLSLWTLSTSNRLAACVFLFHSQEKQSWCHILHQYYGYCKFYA